MSRHFGIYGHQYAGAFEIVGIVADAKYTNPRQEVRPMYFRPLTQKLQVTDPPNGAMAENWSLYINSVTLHFSNPPQNVHAALRRTLADVDPNLTIRDLHSLDYQVAGNFNQERLIARLTTLFGILALVLASVGLYGITSYSVARRTSEIGLRMALGADRGKVVQLVLRGAFLEIATGLVVGIPVALLGGRFMASQLFGVRAWDPVSMGIAIAVLSAAAALAGFIPARRAARIEPMEALRIE